MVFTPYILLTWVISILVLSFGVVILLGNNKLSTRAFALITLLDAFWISAIALFMSADLQSQFVNYLPRISIFLGTAIILTYIYFLLSFPDDSKPSPRLLFSLCFLMIVMSYLFFGTDSVIDSVFYLGKLTPSGIWGWKPGSLYFIFDIIFFGIFIYGLYILKIKLKSSINTPHLKNVQLMTLAMIVGFVPPGLFSIILPQLGIFAHHWIGPASAILWVPIMAYSIARYQQMNIRVVFTEVLGIAMSAIFFINIFIGTFGLWSRISTFLIFSILSYLLLRGVMREARHGDELEVLNNSLSSRVRKQTAEIRSALESEKRARVELEKLNDAKDQFIMITQHHLRTPVTSILWALESVIAGAYGKTSDQLKEVLSETIRSGKRLMGIVNDFLNITAIKVGTNILNLQSVRLNDTVSNLLLDLRTDIEIRQLKISFDGNPDKWPILHVDADKIREILLIVIENAVKYNEKGGHIDINTSINKNTFELIVKNTGIGIDSEESKKIGTSLFYRGADARKSNPIGMGIGLSVVKAIIRAHHGTFEIQSAGKGKGAKVIITLPLASR